MTADEPNVVEVVIADESDVEVVHVELPAPPEVWIYEPDEDVDACPECGELDPTPGNITIGGPLWSCSTCGYRWREVREDAADG